jgi:hypothetical protein
MIQRALAAALDRFDNRVAGEELLPELLQALKTARHETESSSWENPDAARGQVLLAKVLYSLRRISRQEYVFHAASQVEIVHESRMLDGQYDADVRKINEAMRKIEEEHGLTEDQFWPAKQGPKEYEKLNTEHDAILQDHFLRTLHEFGLHDLAELEQRDPAEFARLRERGRRSVFHAAETRLVLEDILVRYEEDARRAASAKAYSAAITLLGSGLEGLLLLRCLRSKTKARRVASTLPRKKRPADPTDPFTWRFETLIDTCLVAGWLPPVATQRGQLLPAGLAHMLRRMRNQIHPARQARERPWSEHDHEDYKDAEAIYVTLMSTILSPPAKNPNTV